MCCGRITTHYIYVICYDLVMDVGVKTMTTENFEDELVEQFSRKIMKKKETIFAKAITCVDDYLSNKGSLPLPQLLKNYKDYLNNQDIKRKILPDGSIEIWYNDDKLYTVRDLPVQVNQNDKNYEAEHTFEVEVHDPRCMNILEEQR